ncbi:GATA transcription factor 11 isoform X1 [Ziziphus jujuba]|uniref:GATA transcription factor 11 isoform X1 n=2 Tax=Ziziphus jujuba TaxID=326968 RepID=A0ABM3IBL3_ZIZJJ|nr:GATA transcription factor 11 isoform X1 [Ziziphus jujuba]
MLETTNDMVGSWFFDENFTGVSEEFNFNGVYEEFFDDVIGSLDDFPLEDVEGNAGEEDWNTKLQYLDPPSMDVLVGFPSKPDKNHSIAFERTQIKQEPSSGDTTSSRSNPLSDDSSDVKHRHQFKTSSPVSILESSSISCFIENPRMIDSKFAPLKRARSKRLRRQQITFPFMSPSSSASENLYLSTASESDTETHLSDEILKPAKRKQKRKKNLLQLSSEERRKLLVLQEQGEAKKCMHCEVTSTPQWREGPMGPKTLCNACGVRYRSGRLFPEYRPAASPTFIPSLHSNSHKKVIEMRSKGRATMGTLSSIQPGKILDSLII